MAKLGDIVKGRDVGYRSCGNNRYIWLACPDCEKERWVMLSKAKSTEYKAYCRSCGARRRAKRTDMLGNGNPQWRSGRHKTSQGYIAVWISPDSPFRSMAPRGGRHVKNYILEHRLIMAQYLGRCLQPWEFVHHRNGIKEDNRSENLYLVNKHTHERHTVEMLLQKEVRLLQWQVKELTRRLNEAGISMPHQERIF